MKLRKALRSGNVIERVNANVSAFVDYDFNVTFWRGKSTGDKRRTDPSLLDLLADDWVVVPSTSGIRSDAFVSDIPYCDTAIQ